MAPVRSPRRTRRARRRIDRIEGRYGRHYAREVAARARRHTRRWAEPGSKSAALWARAQGVMPGGNTRTTVYMSPYPPYAASGEGCWITDVEGDRRLDCRNNYTALIHGHAHPAIVEAATRRLSQGSSFPLPTPEEIELAAVICDRLPSAARVRFTTPMGDTELEGLIETVAAVLEMERATGGGPL